MVNFKLYSEKVKNFRISKNSHNDGFRMKVSPMLRIWFIYALRGWRYWQKYLKSEKSRAKFTLFQKICDGFSAKHKTRKNFISQICQKRIQKLVPGKKVWNSPWHLWYSAKNHYYVFFNRSIMILCQHHLPCSGIWNVLESILSKIKGIWVP